MKTIKDDFKSQLLVRLKDNEELQALKTLFRMLEIKDIWFKGGGFSNILFGIRGRDFDFVTDLTSKEIGKKIDKFIDKKSLNEKLMDLFYKERDGLGVFQFKYNGITAEIACRINKKSQNQLTNKNSYLEKQDCLSNALLYNLETQFLFYLDGSLLALKNREVKIVTREGETMDERFSSHPCKMLRAIRLHEKDFILGKDIQEAIRRNASALNKLFLNANEFEFFVDKTFNGEYAETYFKYYKDLGLFPYFFENGIEKIKNKELKDKIQNVLETLKKEKEIKKFQEDERRKKEEARSLEIEKMLLEEVKKQEEQLKKLEMLKKREEEEKKIEVEDKGAGDGMGKIVSDEKMESKNKKKSSKNKSTKSGSSKKEKNKDTDWEAIRFFGVKINIAKKDTLKKLFAQKEPRCIDEKKLKGLLEEGKYAEVETLCKKEIGIFSHCLIEIDEVKISSYFFMIYFYKGIAARKAGDFANAYVAFNDAIQYKHSDENDKLIRNEMWFNSLAILDKHIENKKYREAEILLADMSGKTCSKPKYVMVYMKQAFLAYEFRKQTEASVDLFEKAIKVFEEIKWWHSEKKEDQQLLHQYVCNLYWDLSGVLCKEKRCQKAIDVLNQGLLYYKGRDKIPVGILNIYKLKLAYVYYQKYVEEKKIDDYILCKANFKEITNFFNHAPLFEDDKANYKLLDSFFSGIKQKVNAYSQEEKDNILDGDKLKLERAQVLSSIQQLKEDEDKMKLEREQMLNQLREAQVRNQLLENQLLNLKEEESLDNGMKRPGF